ncbi:MAG: serine/threonine protein kinase [Myxococcales bacterium]|nr:serine/threonine protein kinase [Myxococcales bacterium]
MRQCPKCNKRFLESNARICDVDGSILDLLVVASERDRLVGTTVQKRYEITGVLGDGGMGVVYRARDNVTGQPYAVKVLRAEYSDEEDLVVRFEQEARAAAAINNPHIVEIYDWGSLPDNSRFFVMEFLEGKSLGDVLAGLPKPPGSERREGLSEGFAIHLALQIAEGLGAAHAIGVVHRDIKPDNFHIIKRGEDAYFVKILDFGIAKVQNSKAARTRTGSVFGTPHYMSPEQASGDRNIDATTDIYGLGVMLYEMIVGKVPFDADNLMGILTAHLYHTPVPPRAYPECEGISPAFEAVILKCLAKTREARYHSMRALYDDLVACRDGQMSEALEDQECHTVRFARVPLADAEATTPEIPVAYVPDPVMPAAPAMGAPMAPPPHVGQVSSAAMRAVPSAFGSFDANPIQFAPAPQGFDTPPGVSLAPSVRDRGGDGRSKIPLVMAVVGGGLLLGSLGFVLLGSNSATEAASGPARIEVTQAPAALRPAAQPSVVQVVAANPAAPSAAPQPAAPSAPVAANPVVVAAPAVAPSPSTVTLDSPGVRAQVFRGNTLIGQTPLVVARPSGVEVYRLTAEDHQPVEVQVGPTSEAMMRVALQPRAGGAHRPRRERDPSPLGMPATWGPAGSNAARTQTPTAAPAPNPAPAPHPTAGHDHDPWAP